MKELEDGKLDLKEDDILYVNDEATMHMSWTDMLIKGRDMYIRDCTGYVSPGLFTLCHNLDPELVIISWGWRDIMEGMSSKDVFYALKKFAEYALNDIPTRNRFPRKVLFYGIPLNANIRTYPDMQYRRQMVHQRLHYFCM